MLLTISSDNHRLGALRVLGRQVSVQLDVADRLAATRSYELETTVIACASLFRRLHLQDVAIVYRSAHRLRRLALADVANGGDLFAQRRRLGGARVKFAINDGDVLVGGLRAEEVSVRLFAASHKEDKVAVVG